MSKKSNASALPPGHVRATHPEGGSCSHGGVEYEASADGEVIVPLSALADLSAHGFVVVDGSEVGEGEAATDEPAAVVDEPLAKAEG